MGNRSNINLIGNTTQGQNVGVGDGVYKCKSVGNILQFKTLSVTGNTMTITTDDNNIYFSANTGGGESGGVGTLQQVTASGCTTTNSMIIGSAASEATGTTSFAQGNGVCAWGSYSHAEGRNSMACGYGSHVEGCGTKACCDYSHTEGHISRACGDYSHAEGFGVYTYGDYSHAEGGCTIACGDYSHASGRNNCGCDNTIAEIGVGVDNTHRCNAFEVYCNGQIAMPKLTGKTGSESCVVYIDSVGKLTHGTVSGGAGGVGTLQQVTASGCTTTNSMIIGSAASEATGTTSFAQGNGVCAWGSYSHAEGSGSMACGYGSHAEGYKTQANGYASHAENYCTHASGYYSHAEGYKTQAIGYCSHAEGNDTIASGTSSHAEGRWTCAIKTGSHAEGIYTCAFGYCSHAEGYKTTANGQASHAEGQCIIANADYSHASGKYNCGCTTTIAEIGVGNDDTHRCNAFEVYCNGQIAMPKLTGKTGSESCVIYIDNTGKLTHGTVSGGGSGTVTSVNSGNGMYFTDITTTGSVALGTPSTLTLTTTNTVGTNTHCHNLNIAAFTASANGLVPSPGTVSGKVLSDNGTWITAGGGTSYTFQQSIAESSGTVNLCNDTTTPGNSKYYGTSSSGVRGFFSLPSGGLSSIAANSILSNSTTSSAVPTELQIADEEIVGRVDGGNVTGVTMIDIFDLSSTTKSLLSSTSNWSSKAYTGTAITDGDAGKMYFDSNYLFYFKTDNTPIRVSLI